MHLPQQHINRAQVQFQQMLHFKAEILEDIDCLHKLHRLFKEKISQNLNSDTNAFGFLRHSFKAYANCLPPLDVA